MTAYAFPAPVRRTLVLAGLLCSILALLPVPAGVAGAAVSPVAAPSGLVAPRGPVGPSALVAPAGPFRWPLDGAPRVARAFDPPAHRWLPGHRGVDLAGAPGAVVRAAGAGQVRYAGILAGRGVVSVEHTGGLRTTYEPVLPAVRTGDAVLAGAALGALTAGHSGCPTGACLHWGLRRGDAYLDPLALLGLARVRLLPLDATDIPPASASGQGGEQRRQPFGQPVVFFRAVVDLAGDP